MTRRVYLPAPDLYTGPNRCGSCLGAGVTGGRYQLVLNDDALIVVDEVCGECQGCGRDPHRDCQPNQHADWEPGDYDADGNDPEDQPADACRSCYGRRWYPVQGFNDNRVTVLRMPCGCAEPLMVEAPR